MSDDEEDKGPNILDVAAYLEDIFKGCEVIKSHGTSSYHASVSFDEYRLRVILSGRRAKDRDIHFRFWQESKGTGRHATKRVLSEVKTTDPKELMDAIKDAKAHLLGLVHAIQTAFKPKPVKSVRTIDDLMND